MVWARSGEGLGRGETWVGGRAELVHAGKRTSNAVRSHAAPNRVSRRAAPLMPRAPLPRSAVPTVPPSVLRLHPARVAEPGRRAGLRSGSFPSDEAHAFGPDGT